MLILSDQSRDRKGSAGDREERAQITDPVGRADDLVYCLIQIGDFSKARNGHMQGALAQG